MNKSGPVEAALTTDLRGEPHNFALWDIQTGTQLVLFKGNKNSPNPKCLQLIDNNYFVTVCDNVLQVWSIFNKKSQDQKLFLPKRPSVICVSPCANYLVAGIAEMIYVWQWKSGNLLAHSQRHYQAVSAIKFTSCGSFLISAGEDGIGLVWSFADLISQTYNTGSLNLKSSSSTDNLGVNEPRFTWQHHSGPITDIHITNGGLCVTASVDMTLNVYDYSSGRRLTCIGMDAPIWSVTMNKNETNIYAGSQEGNIYDIPVSSISLSALNSISEQDGQPRRPTFAGHKGKVSSLSLSADGTRLISGSIDNTCRVWDVKCHKMLHNVRHQAALANLVTLLVPESLALTSMSETQARPPLCFRNLKRALYKAPKSNTVTVDDVFDEAGTPIVLVRNCRKHSTYDSVDKEQAEELDQHKSKRQKLCNGSSEKRPDDKEDELKDLKTKIKALYKLSTEKIFKDSADQQLKEFLTFE